MATNLVNMVSDGQVAQFFEQGFIKIPAGVSRPQAEGIKEDAERIFSMAANTSGKPFDVMKHLFKTEPKKFIHCGKTAQHLISLWRLATSEPIIELVKRLGVSMPNICTRPVLFFNHPSLAIKDIYHTVPAHQDWRSMQGSLNSIVVWIPLMDIGVNHGAIRVLPGSHKRGLWEHKIDHGFGTVNVPGKEQMIDVTVSTGDIVAFNSFLVHESGKNISDKARWSCHFRYNDLSEYTYRQRGYPNPYTYSPVSELITKDFP